MPGLWANLTARPSVLWLAVCGVLLPGAVVVAVRKHLRSRPAPEEVERLRRVKIHSDGKMGDGEIVDIETASGSILYSYTVSGVVYAATQDVSALRHMLPADPMTMIGPISIKFDPRNPANSIVMCEEWSGWRKRRRG